MQENKKDIKPTDDSVIQVPKEDIVYHGILITEFGRKLIDKVDSLYKSARITNAEWQVLTTATEFYLNYLMQNNQTMVDFE